MWHQALRLLLQTRANAVFCHAQILLRHRLKGKENGPVAFTVAISAIFLLEKRQKRFVEFNFSIKRENEKGYLRRRPYSYVVVDTAESIRAIKNQISILECVIRSRYGDLFFRFSVEEFQGYRGGRSGVFINVALRNAGNAA